MFFVSNKYKIISVIIALSTVLILFFMARIIIKEKQKVQEPKWVNNSQNHNF